MQQALVVVLLVHGVARRRGRHGGGLGGVQDLIANGKKATEFVSAGQDGWIMDWWMGEFVDYSLLTTNNGEDETRTDQSNPGGGPFRTGVLSTPPRLQSTRPIER